jgi:hypothetical protein
MCSAKCLPPSTAAPVQAAWPTMLPMMTPNTSACAASLRVATQQQWHQHQQKQG